MLLRAYAFSACSTSRGATHTFDARRRPWDAPPNILNDAGVELGSNYEWPIISMEESRTQVPVGIMLSSPLASILAFLRCGCIFRCLCSLCAQRVRSSGPGVVNHHVRGK